ncbi:hypothetical protein COT48_02040 [Candidatus Woesearchaeota archaeon CG08_land_8_20_14_0_20_47_9]|nr:MAG: hypothetical protein AUJ69_01955 [Candidatus Woesearchaeota archaeon CG1_02_47_18]PIO04122.1 MAG: hypothetical protein COT48_02040 [Candidatus Woesearchaeota archaeon CG08_land_8_20_14_0_20_47_9]
MDTLNVERSFIDRIGKIVKQWGLGEPAGRVWATLLFSERSLSQRQIAEKTGYSLSLVSPSLKILEKLDMVRSIRGQGKEKLYEQAVSFVEAFGTLIKRFVEQDVKPLIAQLEGVSKTVNATKRRNLRKLAREYRHLEEGLRAFSSEGLVKSMAPEKVGRPTT